MDWPRFSHEKDVVRWRQLLSIDCIRRVMLTRKARAASCQSTIVM
jgi:hypothetical protein